MKYYDEETMGNNEMLNKVEELYLSPIMLEDAGGCVRHIKTHVIACVNGTTHKVGTISLGTFIIVAEDDYYDQVFETLDPDSDSFERIYLQKFEYKRDNGR